jgi:hypothetical protein
MKMEDVIAASVARHRHDPPFAVGLNFPIYTNLDTSLCSTVNTDLEKTGLKWEKRLAIKGLRPHLPQSSGLYMFVYKSSLIFNTESDALIPSWVLYVGRAGGANAQNTIRERYKEYEKYIGEDPERLWEPNHPITRHNRLAKYLTIYPLEFWWLSIEDRMMIESLEDRLIKILDPLINHRQKVIKRKPYVPQPAFRSL